MNNLTLAVLRRDRPWLLFLLFVGAGTLATTMLAESFVHIWVLPARGLQSLFHGSWICGAVLGLVAATWDELTGTRDYVRHRPLPPRRLHANRLLGCMLVIAGWFVLTPFFTLTVELWFGRGAHLWQPGNLPFVWLNMLPALSGCAIGWFAGTLPCSLWWRLPAGAATFFPTFALLEELRGATPDSNAPFALGHIAAALLFAAAARVHAGATHDADRPWTMQVRIRSGAVLAIGLAASISLLLGMARKNWLNDLRLAWPMVTQQQEDIGLMLREWNGQTTLWWHSDAEHRRGELVTGKHTTLNWQPRGHLPRDPQFREPRLPGERRRIWAGSLSAVFADGLLHVATTVPPGEVQLRVIGRDAQLTPFAEQAVVAERFRRSWRRTLVCVLEPGSGQVTFVNREGNVERVQLPDGDRFVEMRRVAQTGAGEIDSSTWSNRRWTDVLVGEKHVYLFDDEDEAEPGNANEDDDTSATRLELAAEWAATAARQAAVRPRTFPHVEVLNADPAAPHVRVVDASGTALFEHQFTARSATERLYATLMFATSVAAMPLGQAASFALSESTRPSPFSDFLLRDRRRPWLLLLCLVASFAVAFAHRRRLRKLGAPAHVQTLWFGLGLVCGPTTWLVAWLGDAARAYRRPAPSPVPAPRIGDGVLA